MHRFVKALFLTVFLFAFVFNASTASEEAGSGWIEEESEQSKAEVDRKTGSVVLKIGVQHSKKLEPIPFKLQVGEIFDERILKHPARLRWYRIPEWLAGKWRREQENIVSMYDFRTGRKTRMHNSITSRQIADYGVQKDKKGDIWNCDLSGKGVSNRGSFKSIALIRSHYPVKESKQEIVFKEEFVVLHVMNGSNAIMDSYIVESICSMKPIKRGFLETTMSAQFYLADGTPKVQQESTAYERLIEPYTSVDKYKGIDVHQDFIRFLKERNLNDLIPD